MPRDPFDFDQRNALITGCGSAAGIGFAAARLLARQGARIAITATTGRIEERAAELEAEGGAVSTHVADLTDRRQAFDLVAAAEAATGPLDILVHAAGMVQTGSEAPGARFAELRPEVWQRSFDLNLNTAFHTAQAVLPGMVQRGYGRIVLISSVTGPFVTVPGDAAYAAAKAAMDGMMRTLALEYGRAGITVNSVAPGWIATASSTPVELEAGISTPVGRPGTANEVAGLIVYLSSESASYMTGQSIVVDGGNIIQEAHGVDLYGASADAD